MTESSAFTEIEAGPAASVIPPIPAVPIRRKPARKPTKPDAVLAAAVDTARNGVLEVAGDGEVGEHLGVYPEAERLVTHRFAAEVPGYGGWHWFATLARIPRGKDATVCEVGLLPSGSALLAPDWVPWSERVRPEDTANEAAAQEEAAPAPDAAPGPDASEADGVEPDGVVDGGSTEAHADEQRTAENSSAPGGESPVA